MGKRSVSKKVAVQSLLSKGFQASPRKREGHQHLTFFYEGRATSITTMFSHGTKPKEITGTLLLLMKRQLKLQTNGDAARFLSCEMREMEYIQLLKSIGQLR